MIGDSINLNGCIWCGELERGHGLRYDQQHPSGAHGYRAPNTALRKARLLLKISLRQMAQGKGRVIHP